jgi:hypothetical protein
MFNLADYEPVEVRLEKFIKDYPAFRIYLRMLKIALRGQQGTLRKQLLAEALIRLQHWRIVRLRQSAERLQMQVMLLKESAQAERK